MRILHIYKDYAPVLGGIENHIRILAEAQAASAEDRLETATLKAPVSGVISVRHAEKALEAGVDGLILATSQINDVAIARAALLVRRRQSSSFVLPIRGRAALLRRPNMGPRGNAALPM